MGRYIFMFFAVVLTSFYIFPFDLVYLPGVNTKLLLAIVALVLFMADLAKKRSGKVGKDFILIFVSALFVSFSTYISVIYNGTTDYTYVSYIISAFVWLGGAYTVVCFIKWLHESVSVWLVIRYLIAVCVLQCVLSIAMDRLPAIYGFVDRFVTDLDGLDDFAGGRLYGIGCAFDVAGMRFAAVLIMMGYCFPVVAESRQWYAVPLYLCLLGVVAVIGSMIARTTNIGAVMAMIYVCFVLMKHASMGTDVAHRLWGSCFGVVFLSVLVIVLLYRFDAQFYKDFRFAFEGFFSLAEKGEWDVNSNKQLMSMYSQLPETAKTWLIGDGYFYDTTLDPYYTGVQYKEYYMGIDVGYLRFIFYSGLIGMAAFTVFMYHATSVCMRRLADYKMMFFLLFVLQLLVWGKVATDIFPVFAIFLVCSMVMERDREEQAPESVCS